MPKAPLAPGQIVGKKYEVGQLLASGGYALIFEATRLSDGESVVIKALRPNVTDSDPAAEERFNREATIAAAIDHPNVLRILDFGHTRQGVLYAVLERLYGYTLGDIIHEAPTPPERTKSIVEQILRALNVAHGMGLVHRDIKPDNVFVVQDKDDPIPRLTTQIKLLDFGIAKGVIGASKFMAKNLTGAGIRVGTPGYMAPELLQKQAEMTVLADLYSTGIIGYELLMGWRAFEGEGLDLAVAQMTTNPPPAPPHIAALPLYAVVRKLCAREREDRYPSAQATLDHLAQI